jgi:hypothetical protein
MKTKEKPQQTKEEIARQRLRAQKVEHEKAMREAGMKAGREFVLVNVKEDDVYVQMTALTRYVKHYDHPESLVDLLVAVSANEYSLLEGLQDNYGPDSEETSWVKGFVTGAVAKYRELAP